MLPVSRSSWTRAGVSPLANATSELPLHFVRARPGFAARSVQAEGRLQRAGQQVVGGYDVSRRAASVGTLPPPRRSATISRADAVARGGTVGVAKWRGASDRVERARLRSLAKSPSMSGSALQDPKDFYRAPNLTRFGVQGATPTTIIGPKGPFRPGVPGQPPKPGYLGPPRLSPKEPALTPQPITYTPQAGGPSGSPGGGGGGPGAPVSLRLGVGGGGGGGGSLALAATGTGEPAPSSTLYLLVAAAVAALVLLPRLRGAA